MLFGAGQYETERLVEHTFHSAKVDSEFRERERIQATFGYIQTSLVGGVTNYN